MSQPKLFTKDFISIAIARLGSSMVFATTSATVASYAIFAYGVDVSLAGVATGAFILAAIISRLVAGRYLEVIGRRRLILTAGVAFLAASLLYLVPVPFWAFVVLRAIHGLIFGALNNAINVVSIGCVPRSRLAEGVGYLSLVGTVSSAVGPFVGIWLYQSISYFALFLACSLYAAVGLFLCFFAHIEPIELTEEQREEVLKPFRIRDCFEMAAIPTCIIVSINDLFYYSVSAFLTLYASEIGLGAGCSLFFIVYSAVLFVSRPLAGKLVDRKGDDIVMYPSFLCSIIGYILLAFCQNLPMLLLSAVFAALGRGTVFSTVQTMVVRSVPDYKVGIASGTFFTFADTGAGLGPMIMGTLLPLFGAYNTMYAFEAVATVALVAYYFVLTRQLGQRL